MDNISYFFYFHYYYFDICNYICLDTSYHFWLYLYFLNVLYFFKYSCTNIFHSLRSLIIKMFVNSKSVAIMVNSNSKRAFWSNGSNYAGYRAYTIDKLLEALELILFNTYIQFNGSIFKQILGIPMGGNASSFIADLYLSWCVYCYMTKIVKTDYTLAKLLSYNCRYLDDICTMNVQNFGDIAKDIYDNTLLLEGSTCSYKQDTFWIFISVLLIINL